MESWIELDQNRDYWRNSWNRHWSSSSIIHGVRMLKFKIWIHAKWIEVINKYYENWEDIWDSSRILEFGGMVPLFLYCCGYIKGAAPTAAFIKYTLWFIWTSLHSRDVNDLRPNSRKDIILQLPFHACSNYVQLEIT